MEKKVIYIAGPITGVKRYWEAFDQAEDDLTALGYIPLSPARLPTGMTNAQYARICFTMIDAADAVLFLKGSARSEGARLEFHNCQYTDKPWTTHPGNAGTCPQVRREWLKKELEEVLSHE